ncbi:MAG: hypothetical protein KA105_06020 [Caulobacter sp.]|jgi:hypothetical protein|nr:hypothetical protein [Caulobacter sp.]
MSFWSVAALSALLFAQQAPAAAGAPDAENTIEGITVIAKPAPEADAMQAFVGEITAKSANRKVARWDRKICTGVIGFRADYAQLMVDRVSAIAASVGLQPGEPGCKANMLIIASGESEAMVKKMVDDNPNAFQQYEHGYTRGKEAMGQFLTTEAPVRWWHVTRTVTNDGQRYTRGDSVRVRSAGRISDNARDEFDHVIIVIDAKRVGVVRFGALADYVAMVGLAQIEPDADPGSVQTILNLFSDREVGATAPTGLTDWDTAYLKGLYSTKRDRRTGAAQERDVARAMGDTLGEKPRDEDKKD